MGASALGVKGSRAKSLGAVPISGLVSNHVLGIDLGTLNSCVAVVKDGKAVVLEVDGRTTIPSCIAMTGGRDVVGHAAKRHAVTEPQNVVTAVKRLMGHESIDTTALYDRGAVDAMAEGVAHFDFPYRGRERGFSKAPTPPATS